MEVKIELFTSPEKKARPYINNKMPQTYCLSAESKNFDSPYTLKDLPSSLPDVSLSPSPMKIKSANI